jgi:hypothetical protein
MATNTLKTGEELFTEVPHLLNKISPVDCSDRAV